MSFPLTEIEMHKSNFSLRLLFSRILLTICCWRSAINLLLCISYVSIFLKGNICKTAHLNILFYLFVCLLMFLWNSLPLLPRVAFLPHLPEYWAHRYSYMLIPCSRWSSSALFLFPSFFFCVTSFPLFCLSPTPLDLVFPSHDHLSACVHSRPIY